MGPAGPFSNTLASLSFPLMVRSTLGALVIVAATLAAALPAAAVDDTGFHSAWVGQDSWPTLAPGMTVSYSIRFRNTGTTTWQRGVVGRQVNLGVVNDSTAYSEMAVGWISANRLATTVEAVVAPNAIGTFTFTIRAPARTGAYQLPLRPVADGVTWLEHQGVFVRVTSDAGYHSRWVTQSSVPELAPGATSEPITLTFRNTGGKPWVKGVLGQEARIGIKNDDLTWASLGVGWLSGSRPAAQTEATVAPGANATFTFKVKAPTTPSTYVLALRPVIDGTVWMEDEGVFVAVTVTGGATPRLSVTVLHSGLRLPWDVAHLPDGRMLVSERVGNLLVYPNTAPGSFQLANNQVLGTRQNGEGGLMGIAVDPNFATNQFIYVCSSRDDEGQYRNQVLRYKMVGNQIAFDGYVIRRGMAAAGNHNGCRLRFGPDGKLWVTMGDAGNLRNAQDPNSLNGKVLRVNTDGTIPTDNPVLAGSAGRSAIYTWGNRNPQGLAFQPGTGTPYEVEHGDDSHDEINILAAGANYGYPLFRGPVGRPGYVDPAWSSGNVTIATSGADFVFGPQWGAWSGSLFVAQLKEMDLRRFETFAGSVRQTNILFDSTYGRMRSVVFAPDGALYVTTSNGTGDRILRITATQP
jgi:glucose/arabinose dehydrogenase